jgi:hypothetical protein
LLLFAVNIIIMAILKLQGGEATALIGGTSIIILIFTSAAVHKQHALEKTTKYLIEGLQFGFRVFGPVIPIAAFFYLGGSHFQAMIGDFLPEQSAGIIQDLAICHVDPFELARRNLLPVAAGLAATMIAALFLL